MVNRNINIGIPELGNLDYVVGNQIPDIDIENITTVVPLNITPLSICEELERRRQSRSTIPDATEQEQPREEDAQQSQPPPTSSNTNQILSESSRNKNIVLRPVFGKKNLYVLSENVGNTVDGFRKFLNNYWEIKGKNLLINTGSIPEKVFSIITGSLSSGLDGLYSTSVISSSFDLETFDTSSLYKDIVFQSNYAFTGQQIKYGQVASVTSSAGSSLVVSVENDYNFYIPAYEKLEADEKLLPNFYILLSNYLTTNSDPSELNKAHKALLTLNGSINIQASNDEFYDIFSSEFKNLNEPSKTLISEKMKTVVFSEKDYKKFKEFQSYSVGNKKEKTQQKGKKEQIPFYTKLEIDTEEYGRINEGFNESGLTELLMCYAASSRLNKTKFHKAEKTENPAEVTTQEINFGNVFEILENIGSGSFSWNTGSVTYLGSLENKIEDFESVDLRIQELMSYSVLKDLHINRKITLNYANNLVGAECYSETIFYKIEKYSGSSLIQTFYIPNTQEAKSLSIIDSQIKYGKKYKYNIHSYKIVLGNENFYRKEPSEQQLTVYSIPSMYLISSEYCSLESRISDKPPAPPEVDIIPFKDNDSELLFLLNTSAVEYELMPVFLNDKEKNDYNKIRESQQVLEGQKIKFGGEDRAKEFWIYRLETQPFSINEFEGRLYEKIDTKCASSASFKDMLIPNKKYYYMFRTLDVHNNLSNPSEIYEVELISENGLSFLKTNIVEFKKKEFKKETKSLKRYLHIRPAFQQISINDSDLDLTKTAESVIEGAILGLVENSMWEQKYKIRVRSKNTNKFMDIYFTFKQTTKPQNPTNLKETCE